MRTAKSCDGTRGNAVLTCCILLIVSFFLASSAVCFAPIEAAIADEVSVLPEIVFFDVTPGVVARGESALLTWQVYNLSAAYIDNDIGLVQQSGRMAVSPAFSTTYGLSAVNPAGTSSKYITLQVNPPGVPKDTIVRVDPVSGRNSSVDMSWEDYCYSDMYQVQIARDPEFTLKVFDSGIMQPAAVAAPAFWYPPGQLEAGYKYYWRVRARKAVTGQWAVSPWSAPVPFIVNPGYATRTSYSGVQALNPAENCAECEVSPLFFSWTGYPGIARYRFMLARDPGFKDIVTDDFSTSTAYSFIGKLEHATAYYWQVVAMEPIPGEVSAVFTFRTVGPTVDAVQGTESETAIPGWALTVIILGSVLCVAVLILVLRAGKRV
jgi:hypothetical protein